jgi:hypothetical protein
LQVASKSSGNKRAFIRFDLARCAPGIPTTATIKQATLSLALATAPSSTRNYNIYRVTGPCPEGAATCWTETGITWNNQPTTAGTPTSTLTLGSGSATVYYSWDVTVDAAAIVAGTVANDGWRISDSAEGAFSAVTAQFESTELTGNANEAPVLVVIYAP